MTTPNTSTSSTTSTPIARNAAGTPLVLIGHADPAMPTAEYVNTADIPLGVMGHVYPPEEIALMTAAQRQNLFEQLIAKYDGVSVDEGNGVRAISLEFEMTSQDDALYQSLLMLGAVRPAPVVPVAPTPTPEQHAVNVAAVQQTVANVAVAAVALPPDHPAHSWLSGFFSVLGSIGSFIGPILEAAALQKIGAGNYAPAPKQPTAP